MKKALIFAAGLFSALTIYSQDKLFIHQNNGISLGIDPLSVGEITIDETNISPQLVFPEPIGNFDISSVDSITFENTADILYISYDGSKAKVLNPLAYEGVDVSVSGADVIVSSSYEKEVEYVLSGKTTDGSFKIYSDKKFILTLNGIDITKSDGAAINIQSGKKVTVNMADNTVNRLTDGAVYNTVEGEDMKGAFFSEGQLIFTGNGSLNVVGNCRHGICSDDYIIIESGNICVEKAATDAIHVNDYIVINGGKIDVTASSDGFDAGDG